MRGRWLLIAGAVAPILYAGTVVVGGAIRPGYSHVRDSISELIEIGAPNVLPLDLAFMAASLLGVAFGIGLLLRLGRRSTPFVVAGAGVVLVGLLSFLIEWFPVDTRPGPRLTAEWIHLGITGVVLLTMTTLLMAFALGARREAGFGSSRRASLRQTLRRRAAFDALAALSFVTFGVVLATGFTTAVAEETDWSALGMVERFAVGAYLVWMFVVATALLRRPGPASE